MLRTRPGSARIFQLGIVAFVVAALGSAAVGQVPLTVDYSVPGVSYAESIPTPDDVWGHTIGSRHTRPHELVEYFEAIASVSDRVTVHEYARSHQHRPLVYAIVTSTRNHDRLESIRQQNVRLSDEPDEVSDDDLERMPVVINLHYSVHGNEASGSEAAVLMLYHLAAGRGDRVEDLLEEAVVIIDPVLNPDGRDRFVDWANGNRGGAATTDPANREHNEPWPNGRTNHYWFDLNRDWLPVQHPESQGRLKLFHTWRPQVLLDAHEMGGNRSFFFQPGIPSRGNPNTPQKTFDLTDELTRGSAEALDAVGSLYYTRESFDDFYYGKGSTYPDVNGAIGILFEQGSSRALIRHTKDGVLDYGFTVKNQLAASIGLAERAVDMRVRLLANQRDFYRTAMDEAGSAGFDGWLIGSDDTPARTRELVKVLLHHRIAVHPIKTEVTVDAKTFSPGSSYLIPARQPQFKLIKSSFETVTTFRDSLFYDVSTWTLPLAFGVPSAEFSGTPNHVAADPITDLPAGVGGTTGGRADVAYVMEWGGYYAPRALAELLDAGVPARVMLEPFEVAGDGGLEYFDRGAIVVPVRFRDGGPADAQFVHEAVQRIAQRDQVRIHAVNSSLTPGGIDLGSPRSIPLSAPQVAVLTGRQLSAYRAGEVWHLLTEKMRMAVTLLDLSRVKSTPLHEYGVVVLVDGDYKSIPSDLSEILRDWVAKGGRLVTMGLAAKWVVDEGIVNAEFVVDEVPETSPWVRFGDRETVSQARKISGAIFEVDVDPTHPIAFGLPERVAVFKTRYSVLKPSIDAGTTVAVYRPAPLLSGYAPADRVAEIARSAAVATRKLEQGRVVLIQDVPTFRAFWYGTDHLLLNSILFAEAY